MQSCETFLSGFEEDVLKKIGSDETNLSCMKLLTETIGFIMIKYPVPLPGVLFI